MKRSVIFLLPVLILGSPLAAKAAPIPTSIVPAMLACAGAERPVVLARSVISPDCRYVERCDSNGKNCKFVMDCTPVKRPPNSMRHVPRKR